MSKQFGQDNNGVYKLIEGGGVLRVSGRIYNAILVRSQDQQDDGWLEGW